MDHIGVNKQKSNFFFGCPEIYCTLLLTRYFGQSHVVYTYGKSPNDSLHAVFSYSGQNHHTSFYIGIGGPILKRRDGGW